MVRTIVEQKISEVNQMKKNTPSTTPKKPGRSENIPAEVPEPDQDASDIIRNGHANTMYSGMRGNMVLFLADRQDRVAERQNKKIERIEQRLAILEERERSP